MITAITAVGALIFTGLSLNATRAQTALNEQSQITDRYSKAVEQIGRQGPESLQIRLGGIYALERLAHDSPRDLPIIVDVLSAFVRTSTKPAPSKSCPHEPPDADVQAALTVLGRRIPTQGHNNQIDLHHACLALADLQNVDLTGAYLADAYLDSAFLVFARLNNAQLDSAHLHNAYLFDANLSDAYLTDANLEHAYLVGAHLNGAYLDGANLTLADLTGAGLAGAKHNESTRIDRALTDLRTVGKWW